MFESSGRLERDRPRILASCPVFFTCVRPPPFKTRQILLISGCVDGGGWVVGSKGSELHQCTNYCVRARCVVVTVDCEWQVPMC
jgi:hypothetical protein